MRKTRYSVLLLLAVLFMSLAVSLTVHADTGLDLKYCYYEGSYVFCPAVDLPVTGQNNCYDTNWEYYPCNGTGQDGEIRAGLPWPTTRFSTNGDGTITDSMTGLTWLTDANCITTNYPSFDADGTSSDGKVTWQHALKFVDGMNAGTYPLCAQGHLDWRVPNVNELESLTNADVPQSALWLISKGFINAQLDRYWSSTSYSPSPYTWAWFIHMRGNGVYPDSKSSLNFLWPVRGVSSGPSQIWQTGQTISYLVGDDGDLEKGVIWNRSDVGRFMRPDRTGLWTGETVLDTLTGLVWTRDALSPGPSECIPGLEKYWQDALTHVACLNSNNYLGSQEWRLPNRKEIFSLFNYGAPNLMNWFYGVGFSNVRGDAAGYYWTSTTHDDDRGNAWGGYLFWLGEIASNPKTTETNYVWPVRSIEVKIRKNGKPVYSSDNLQDAFEAADDGAILETQATVFTGPLLFDRPIAISLEGGYSPNSLHNPKKTILIIGSLTIRYGKLTVENLIIK